MDRDDPAFDKSHFVEIPKSIRSMQALLYMGMRPKLARRLWNGWFEKMVIAVRRGSINLPKTFKACASEGIVIFAPGDVSRRYARRDWVVSLLIDSAADRGLRSAILDLLHTKTSESNSPHYWVINSANIRYRELEEIQRTSHQRARVMRMMKTQGDIDHFFQNRAAPLDGPGYCIPRLERDTWTMAVVQAHINHDPDVTVLYKIADIGKLSGFWTRDAQGNNTYDLSKLVDDWCVSSPDQVSARNGVTRNKIVFHEYIRTAEAEAAYAWRRAKRGSSIVILTLTIKNSDIKQLEASRDGAVMRQKWSKTHWKLYTWWCMARGGIPTTFPQLEKYANATLLIRAMAHAGLEHYAAIRAGDLARHCPHQFLYTYWGIGREGRCTRRYFKKEPREYIFASDETAFTFLRKKSTFKAFLVTSTNIKAMARIEQHRRVNWQFNTLSTDPCDLDLEEVQPMDLDHMEPDFWDEPVYSDFYSDEEE